ncbi:histone deacetylase family protein [Coralliovum pocilloporae]|uniref:histone deacetylase family protein n=1 Tax=Coralliovum pocilloporae TaxID=3066369 RepID=UPI003306F01F
MKTVFSSLQLNHRPTKEMADGQLVDAVEIPRRAEIVHEHVKLAGFGEILEPKDFGRAPLTRVHTEDYVSFLETFWADWLAEGRDGKEAFPFVWPVRGLRDDRVPEHIDGKLGRFSFDAGSPLTVGTWEAAAASANTALTAAELVKSGDRVAFGLCRPPGHHAGPDYYGGYCFLNNASVATQWLLDQGASKVALLDIDYHHGNGSQTIFEHRSDVLFLSVHADPAHEYPYFLGYADETGKGEGEGYTANYPLPFGTPITPWMDALEHACKRIKAYGAEALVISLGMDTFERDPISKFKLKTDDFPGVGERLAQLNLPTTFIMEGGYAVDDLGRNTTALLGGFLSRL